MGREFLAGLAPKGPPRNDYDIWDGALGVRPAIKANLPLIAFVLIVGSAFLAPLLPLHDPAATALDQRLLSPLSAGHLLGTDHLGRDILSRLLHGTRLSLWVALVGTGFAALVGGLLGLLSGYLGRWVDALIMRSVDMLMAFPYLLLALTIVAVLGPGLSHATLAIAIVNVPFFARTVRGSVMHLLHEDFVALAKVSGFSKLQIAISEVLPHVYPVLAIAATTSFGWMILETAGLSFLGLGAQPPQADLGGMLGQGRMFLTVAPHVALAPGFMIFLVALCLNLLGDRVRDALDPKLRNTESFDEPQQTAAAPPHSQSPSAQPPSAQPPSAQPPSIQLPSAQAAPTQASSAQSQSESARTGGAPSSAASTAPRPPEALLSVSELGIELVGIHGQRRTLLSELSFSLQSGERLALVGASGSGKSLTARALLGLLPPDQFRVTGTLDFAGRHFALTPAALAPLRGSTIALVPQDPGQSLHPLYRIMDQLLESMPRARRRRGGHEFALELLAQVHLRDPLSAARAYPHELSGGMRQRCAIAMALAGAPDLIIADEPTTALDVTVQAVVVDLLREICDRRGLGLLFISHDLALVSELCSRVLVLDQGRIVETGVFSDVVRAPRAEATAKLVEGARKLSVSTPSRAG